ncbi:MAG: D-alanyl-D-alanine carboxypeptidase family protein [Peptococcia bacterium]|jgi:D-alanyl-D-alanine carboxypeptidase (penicillin-binding protein 5/6)
MSRKCFFIIFSCFLLFCLSKPLLAQPILNGKGAVLIDAQSGQVLFAKNKDEKLPPASITKILTAIIALESGKLDKMVAVGANPPLLEGTRVYLEEGEKVSLHNLVLASLVYSANDAALAIAEYLGGTEEKFTEMMNKKARELGAVNSNFVNAHGLTAKGHYTTAYDMAMITRYAMNNSTFREVVNTKVVDWQGKAWQTKLINKNELLWSYEGANGVKTGYTTEAKCTIVASAVRQGQSYITVVLGSQGKETWADAQKLLDFGFKNYQTVQLARPEEIVVTLDVDDKKKLHLIAEQGFALSLPQAGNKNVESRLSLKPLGKSVAKGQVVGEIIYTVNGKDEGSVNLVAKEQVKAWRLLDLLMYSLAGLYLVQILWRISQQWRKRRRRKNMFAPSQSRRYYQEY